MKTYTLTTLAVAASTALAGFSVGPHNFAGGKSTRHQHRALAGRAVLPPTVAGNGSSGFVLKKRVTLAKRKVLGTGDSATLPSNAAKGTFDAAAGCTVWHTVSAGEVCLGLIDKSSPSFSMALFHTYNPALNGDCDNLQVGTAYCVDNAPVSTATDVAVATPPKVAAVVPSSASGKTSKADTSPDDDEDCDDDEDDDTEDGESDDEETCEDDGEDDYEDSAAPAASNARAPALVAAKPSPSPSPSPKASPSPAASSNNNNANDNSNTNNGNNDSNGNSNSSSNNSPSLASAVTGQATYYLQNGNKGACGNAAQDSDYVVALYTSTYGSGGNCGKKITITNTSNGRTATAIVADMCPGCSGSSNNIDMSKGLFEYLSNNNLGAGVLPIKWAIQ